MAMFGARLCLAAASFGIALAMAVPAVSASECATCDTVLRLKPAEWRCLEDRLEGFRRDTTPIVMFTLSNKACSARGGASRGNAVKLPGSGDRSGATSSYVFTLRRDQLDCLERQRKAVLPGADGLYVIDLRALCGAARAAR
jgi:hypothetical protein